MSEFEDFRDSVLLDIKDAIQQGLTRTKYRVPERWVHMIDAIVGYLEELENPYKVSIEGDARTLVIKWAPLPTGSAEE